MSSAILAEIVAVANAQTKIATTATKKHVVNVVVKF